MAVDPHVHMSAAHIIVGMLATIAIFGTLHLLSLTYDNRFTRAWIALGF
jgi:hypothetical protein